MMKQNQSTIHNSSHIKMSLLRLNIKVDVSNHSTRIVGAGKKPSKDC